MTIRGKLIVTGYVMGTPLILAGLCLTFFSGTQFTDIANIRLVLAPLMFGVLLLLMGILCIGHFVAHAYLGQEIRVEDLPSGLYQVVDKNGYQLVLTEAISTWTPFGRRNYHVFYKGKLDQGMVYHQFGEQVLRMKSP